MSYCLSTSCGAVRVHNQRLQVPASSTNPYNAFHEFTLFLPDLQMLNAEIINLLNFSMYYENNKNSPMFIVVYGLISTGAALANDRLYPDCRLSRHQASEFVQHLRSHAPRCIVRLAQRRQGGSGWKKIQQAFEPPGW